MFWFVAIILVTLWTLSRLHIWGFEGYKEIFLIFAVVAILMQLLTFRRPHR